MEFEQAYQDFMTYHIQRRTGERAYKPVTFMAKNCFSKMSGGR
jgi:hypothetical protein